jgi:hypothetical protein
MPTTDQFHSFEGLMGCFITLNYRSQLARDLTNFHRQRISLRHHHTIQDIALGKNTEQLSAVVDDTNSAYVSRGHEFSRFLHCG